jgi:hypothetical protein
MLIESNETNSINYVIVFDLDETLGHFTQLYTFWMLLIGYINESKENEKLFFKLLDLFPKFLRPSILNILKNIKNKKKKNICNYVMIYTNNNGPKSWATMIQNYFHYKLKYELFDKIIGAFKVDGKHVEVCRTSYGKSLKDFINCTKLPSNTQICFLDDQKHDDMYHQNVLYINLKPYFHNINFEKMASKTYEKMHKYFPKNRSKEDFIKYIKSYTKNYTLDNVDKTKVEYNIEKVFSNVLVKKIDKFFKTKPRKFTKKYRKRSKHRKKYTRREY